ncbi:MAG: hypothetical protein AUH05_02490 [Ktedonobacter sp. 13_2_20CM_53_11]|nr:MAG: hypothetical protein AUH05_02490 [Ktedonobacter sp. 13_2_20CM_53_11]
MSRAPLHALIWSAEQRLYGLYTRGQLKLRFRPAEEAAWLAWLGSVSSFAFHGKGGPKRAAPASAISDKRKASRWRG